MIAEYGATLLRHSASAAARPPLRVRSTHSSRCRATVRRKKASSQVSNCGKLARRAPKARRRRCRSDSEFGFNQRRASKRRVPAEATMLRKRTRTLVKPLDSRALFSSASEIPCRSPPGLRHAIGAIVERSLNRLKHPFLAIQSFLAFEGTDTTFAKVMENSRQMCDAFARPILAKIPGIEPKFKYFQIILDTCHANPRAEPEARLQGSHRRQSNAAKSVREGAQAGQGLEEDVAARACRSLVGFGVGTVWNKRSRRSDRCSI